MDLTILSWNMNYWKNTHIYQVNKEKYNPYYKNNDEEVVQWKRNISNYLKKFDDVDIFLLQEIKYFSELPQNYLAIYHELSEELSDISDPWGSIILTKHPYAYVKPNFYNSNLFYKDGFYYPCNESYVGSKYFGWPGLMCYDIKLLNGEFVTAINIYGKKDRNGYFNTTIHHMLSDLTSIINKRNDHVIILGGDFNTSLQRFPNNKEDSHLVVSDNPLFDRIIDFGLENCTLKYFGKHIRTSFANYNPWQLDYIFVNNVCSNEYEIKVLNPILLDHYKTGNLKIEDPELNDKIHGLYENNGNLKDDISLAKEALKLSDHVPIKLKLRNLTKNIYHK